MTYSCSRVNLDCCTRVMVDELLSSFAGGSLLQPEGKLLSVVIEKDGLPVKPVP